MDEGEKTDRDEWTTPPKLFSWLDSICEFNLDAAASIDNHLCENFYTKEDSALAKEIDPSSRIFCNPPYSLDLDFARWGFSKGSNVAMLLPVRSDRTWFQKLLHSWDLRRCWFTGRLHFGGSGKGAFMYSILIIKGFPELSLPDYICASLFNDGGKGAATY